MTNLFIVFTPFQLFVAQQIVNQEELSDNILIEGYIGNNSHFYDIYDMMEMDNYWKKRIKFPDIVSWDGLRVSSIKDAKKAYDNYKKLKKILKDNKVDTIFLGEHQNQTMRFTDILFSHQGYKVCFYEEGAAHYIDREFIPDNSVKNRIRIIARDLFYYLPIYHVRFAKWRYNVNMPYEGLPIHKRFNILPLHHESYDVDLKVTSLISKSLESYMEKEIGYENSKILFMTDPLAEIISPQNMPYYFETISDFLKDISKETTIYIKYHPRDPLKYREKTLEIIKSLGLKYRVLSERINIPVEYFLQKYKFEKVYLFNASTYYYDGYVFPHCEFVKMLPTLYKKCVDSNAKGFERLKKHILAME